MSIPKPAGAGRVASRHDPGRVKRVGGSWYLRGARKTFGCSRVCVQRLHACSETEEICHRIIEWVMPGEGGCFSRSCQSKVLASVMVEQRIIAALEAAQDQHGCDHSNIGHLRADAENDHAI